MSWFAVGTAVVGGVIAAKGAKDAAKAGAKGQEAGSAIIKQAADEARRTIFEMVPIAEQNYQLGTQAGLDVLGQSIAPQSQLARGGNIAAQNTLISGLGQQQNAILGRPTDLSQLQAFEGGAIPDINYQLPEFISAVPESQLQRDRAGDQAQEEVTRAYQEILGRAPDVGGLQYYTDYISSDGLPTPAGIKKMRKEMAASAEEKRLLGSGA